MEVMVELSTVGGGAVVIVIVVLSLEKEIEGTAEAFRSCSCC